MNSSAGNSKVKANENIQVYVRVRPINARERGIRSHEIIDVPSPKEIVVRQPFDSKMTKKFYFDRTFGPDSKQSEVYHSVVSPLIKEVLSGYNCTVFAYGQTGTGKTHTMIGTECPELKSSWEDDSMVGIIPRALSHLFDELRLMEVEFSMRVSYLELYNEELCDLLSTDDTAKIRIYDDANKKGSVIIQGLEEITVHSKDDLYKLLEKGQERRKTATTLMNAQSSRSHTVLSIVVHIKENGLDGEEMLKIGKLNLVDLAGSENISKAGNEKGIRTRETVNINQSLLTLGRVITALVERTPHIPYRESKLTRLLQESLGGCTKTSIIATISPGHKDIDETLSTLEYAHRAKNIQNKPELNQKLTKKTVLKEYTEEIDKLRRDLMAAREKNGVYLAEETYYDMQFKLDSQNRELNEKMLLIKAIKDELTKKEKIFNEVSLHLVEKSEECKTIEKNFSQTKTELDQTKKVLTTTKRRYKEKKLLLDNHVKTEQELTGQAKELIEVADVATTHTVQLHDTIERRKDVDVKIKTSCEKFTESLKSSISEIADDLINLEDKQKKHCHVIMEELNINDHHQKTFSTEITKSISTLSDIQKDLMKEINSSFDKVSNLLTNGDTEYSQNIIQKVVQELKQKQHDFQINFDSNLKEMTGFIDIHNGFVETNSINIKNKVCENNRQISSFSTNAMEQLKKFSEDIAKDLKVQYKSLNSSGENYKNLSNERTKVMEETKVMMETLMQKWTALEQDQQTETSKLEKVSQNLQLSRDKVVDNMRINKNSIDAFSKDCAIKSEELEKCINDFKTSVTTSLSSEQLVVNALEELSINNKKIVLEQIDSLNDLLNQRNEERKIILQDVNKDITELDQKICTRLENECSLTEDAIKSECERIRNFNIQSMSLNTSLLDNVTEYSTVCHGQIEKCVDRIEEFRNYELKTYTPTGQTPSRREFSYPRILAATSPHDRILRRFKLENEWSDMETTITEDSETTMHDISNDRFVINSTPIKQHNPAELPENLLKSIPSEFNFKIPLIQISNVPSKENSPAEALGRHYDKENKENC